MLQKTSIYKSGSKKSILVKPSRHDGKRPINDKAKTASEV